MRYYRLKQVSALLGGTPKPGTLRDWCRRDLIPHSRTIGGNVYLLSEEQLEALSEQLQGGNDAQIAQTQSSVSVARTR
jgi:hypothetical protein